MEKAISIKQPWAYLICAGIKDVENRTWATKFRGRVYIHASAKSACNNGCSSHLFTEQQFRSIKKIIPAHPDLDRDFQGNSYSPFFFEEHELSAIIGYVDIVDCVVNYPSIWAEKSNFLSRTFVDPEIHNLSEWITDDNNNIVHKKDAIYNWVLANPILFDKPILNVKGKLSFWDCSEHIKLK